MSPPSKFVQGVDRLLGALSKGTPPAVDRILSGLITGGQRAFPPRKFDYEIGCRLDWAHIGVRRVHMQANLNAKCRWMREMASPKMKAKYHDLSWADFETAADRPDYETALASLRHQLMANYLTKAGPFLGETPAVQEPKGKKGKKGKKP
ncbi:hypothetical protein UCDDS831_g01441 [Diplodia seriata]|uniref:Uncharacterized protein n=1 Tax=Diplodia seriata TaxID=420778 RepID=A0A0G2EWA9_9PEZI|nr:hypothetical protein UCDDS831_g01441 [Diplodia seriata]